MTTIYRALTCLIGLVLLPAPRRDERGLSQSTENAILLAGAIAIAAGIVTAVTVFVQSKLSELG